MFEVFGRTGPPTLGGPPFWTLKIATHCNADQRTRNAATRCVLRAYNAAKCDCGRGSAPDTVGGAYIAPPDSLAGFKGRGGEGKGGRERGEGQGWRRRGGEILHS